MLTNSPARPKAEPITPEIIERVEARLRAARTKMFFKGNWAFFGYLAMHLKMHPVAELGTCATDGDHFLYDPIVLDQERLEWLEFNWAHEVLHLFGLDLSLKPKDDIMVVGVDKKGQAATAPTSLWNLACDLYNNLKLEEEGFTVPPFVPIDKKYKGWTKLQIYEDLKKTAEKNGVAHLPKGACCGGFMKKPGGKLSDVKDLEAWKPTKSENEKWANLAKEALEASKSRGKAPAFAETIVQKLLQPRQNWREILWQFCQRIGKEWRFTPPSRTGAARNVVLPRIVPEDEIEHGVLVFDTSGSIGDNDLEDFLAEVNAICTTIRLKVTVMMVDADVHDVYEFEPGEFDAKILKFTGRGGTDFRPAFLRVRDMDKEPTFLVYFTDSYGTFPSKAPSYPVLWALSVPPAEKEPVPWGQIIHLRHEVY
jgi:predicted metal-dependent peptidase